MKYVLLLLCLWFSAPAYATGVDTDVLADPAGEARARNLMEELRCLVCQNQSIADSDATLAEDLRRIVRERIIVGDSDAQIKAYLVQRYGNWILLDPPLAPATWLLWFGPLLVLGVGVAVYIRRTRSGINDSAPLTDSERQRLDTMP